MRVHGYCVLLRGTSVKAGADLVLSATHCLCRKQYLGGGRRAEIVGSGVRGSRHHLHVFC